MISDHGELGYDAQHDTSEVFESPEKLEQLQTSLDAMWNTAQTHDAVGPYQFAAHRLTNRSGRMPGTGTIEHYEQKDPIDGPKLDRSEWRTFIGEDDSQSFHWSISRPEGKPDAPLLIGLTTPLGIGGLTRAFMSPNAAEVAEAIKGYRILEYVIGNDGKLHGRSTDYSYVYDYRLIENSAHKWDATENEANFVFDSLKNAELIDKAGKRTGIIASTLTEQAD